MSFFGKKENASVSIFPQIPALQQIGQLSNAINNPMQVLMQMVGQNNPLLAQILPMVQGKSPEQIEQAARALCKENGVDVNALIPQARAVMKQIGVKL